MKKINFYVFLFQGKSKNITYETNKKTLRNRKKDRLVRVLRTQTITLWYYEEFPWFSFCLIQGTLGAERTRSLEMSMVTQEQKLFFLAKHWERDSIGRQNFLTITTILQPHTTENISPIPKSSGKD